MSLKKRMNRTLALGLTVSSVFVSSHTIYALNDDVNKETVKAENKIELKVDKKEEIETTKRVIVTASVLNVRKEASKESDVIGALTENTVVTVLETKDEWSKVQLSDEKEGWINNEYTSNEKAKVNVDELNLRKEPVIEENKLEVLKRNTELEILGVVEVENKKEETAEMWYEVKIVEDESKVEAESKAQAEEKTGFVHADYALTESEEVKLKEEARKKAEAEAQAKAKAEAEAQKTVQANQVVSSASSNNSGSTETKELEKETASSNVSGRTITVNASAYSGDGITATGTVPKWGTIAVDPSVIPYGTKVYIPMFDKVFIAEDCGGAIKGNKIDIFMNSSEETKNFGRRNIEIQILG